MIFQQTRRHRAMLAAVISALFFAAVGQTPIDFIQMKRGEICVAALIGQDAWTEYWEGSLRRDNPNLGTVTSRSAGPMAAIGLRDRLNVLASLPFVSNRASAGQMSPESGFQDLSVWAKFTLLDRKIGPGELKLFALGGFSMPVSNYWPDYLPLALGSAAKTGTARGMIFYRHSNGLFVGGYASFTSRSNVRAARDFYWANGQAFYTNEIDLPNVVDWSATVGFFDGHWKAQAGFMAQQMLSGDDIRRNDMPFPTNKMNALRLMAIAQRHFAKPQGFGLTLNAAQTVAGRNVGRAVSFGGGVLYQFQAVKPKGQKTK